MSLLPIGKSAVVPPGPRPATDGRAGATRRQTTADTVADPTYRRLLGEAAWRRLPVEVRRRFSQAPAAGHTLVYRGSVSLAYSRAGRVFAMLCHALGRLLPPAWATRAIVDVELDRDPDGGIRWSRRYRYGDGRTVVVRSTKCVGADGRGLSERVGRFFIMPLDVRNDDGRLEFVSTSYAIRIGRIRLPIPGVLTPGTTRVSHTQIRGGLFRFTLSVRHRWLGETVRQDGLFQEFTRSRPSDDAGGPDDGAQR